MSLGGGLVILVGVMLALIGWGAAAYSTRQVAMHRTTLIEAGRAAASAQALQDAVTATVGASSAAGTGYGSTPTGTMLTGGEFGRFAPMTDLLYRPGAAMSIFGTDPVATPTGPRKE
jgi:L,D-peptidoglycan transpeptidase YkuD (ErfK/YbiS/YcfS/YnhG family)